MSRNSPRYQGSKTPTSHGETEEEFQEEYCRSVFDDLQRQVEEEIENADKAICVADELVAEYESRTPPAHYSRAGSPSQRPMTRSEYQSPTRPVSYQTSRAGTPEGRAGPSRPPVAPRSTYNPLRKPSSVLAEKATTTDYLTPTTFSSINSPRSLGSSPTYGVPIMEDPQEFLTRRKANKAYSARLVSQNANNTDTTGSPYYQDLSRSYEEPGESSNASYGGVTRGLVKKFDETGVYRGTPQMISSPGIGNIEVSCSSEATTFELSPKDPQEELNFMGTTRDSPFEPIPETQDSTAFTVSPYSLATSWEFDNSIPASRGMAAPRLNQFVYRPAPVYGQRSTPLSEPSSAADKSVEEEQQILLKLSNLSSQKKSPFMDEDSPGSSCAERQKKSPERKYPKKPDLTSEELNELIQSETEDVESVWHLTSDQRKTYKKPCPKQEKAHMHVKHIVHADVHHPPSTSDPCVKEYPPMIDPAPDDITPEIAALMMFTQEQGIKMEGCPRDTINYFFPDERRAVDTAPTRSISTVDQNEKKKEEMMEKSAGVPSEGVSDSAYTKTMKQKGEDPGLRSFDLDFALNQDKQEYVLLPQKPQRESKFQFRGNLPIWFPGYYSAFPDQGGNIIVVPSPSKLFHKAWVSSNPGSFPSNDLIVLD